MKHKVWQVKEFFCAAYCFYIIYLTKVLGTVFKSAILNLYYQKFSLQKLLIAKMTTRIANKHQLT